MKYIQILVAAFLLATSTFAAEQNVESTEAPDVNVTTTTTEAPKIPCQGKGKVCVAPKLCRQGFIDGNTLERNYNYVSETGFFLD